MTSTKDAAAQFLAQKRIAVTGVSRTPEGHGANIVYQRPRDTGYEAFAVNPDAGTLEGDPCFPSLAAIPGGVDAVVIVTSPAHAETTMREAPSSSGPPTCGCTAPSPTDRWWHLSGVRVSRRRGQDELKAAAAFLVAD